MKKYFVAEDGRIDGECFSDKPANPSMLQIIELDDLPEPCTDYVVQNNVAVFAPVAVAVPSSCTRRQGRLALLNAGKLDAVETAIEAISDPTAKRQSQIEYEADTWERSNLFLQQMWANLGGTSEELDALFTLAVTL